MTRLKRFVTLLAVLGTLLVAGVGAGATPASSGDGNITYNVEGGGAAPTSFFYIARVYIYYNGYWHWLNCQYVVYTDGSARLYRCW